MSEEIKVSVIMPVYNGEKYLRQCLDSVCGQSLSEIEIICVDDGSTDSSPDILQEYAQKDDRVIIITQQNQYAGVARNNGIKKSRGKYVICWDSDDFFNVDALEKLYDKAEETGAQVVICGASQYFEEVGELYKHKGYLNMKYVPEKETFCFEDCKDDLLRITSMVTWNKLVRKDLIDEYDIKYLQLRTAQDIFYTAAVLYFAKSIAVIDEVLVNYRKLAEGSLTSTMSKTADTVIEAWTRTYELISKNKTGFERGFANRALESLVGALNITVNYIAFTGFIDKLKEMDISKMGIVYPAEEGYYYNSFNVDLLDNIYKLSTQDYHSYFVRRSFENYVQKQRKLTNVVEKKDESVKKLRNKNERLSSKNERLLNKNERLEEKKEHLESKIEKLEDDLDTVKQKLQDIKNSKAYKIGSKIAYIPRKIRGK